MSSSLDTGVSIKAFHIAEKLKLKEICEKLGKKPVFNSGEEVRIPLTKQDSLLFAFRFGSVVFCNTSDSEIRNALEQISEQQTLPERKKIYDDLEFKRINLNSEKSVRMASLLLAQSTALEHYEIIVEELLQKASDYSNRLKKHGKFLKEDEDFVKFIGECLHTRQEMISNLYVLDSPDETWEDSELEKQFLDLKGLLDIDARFSAIEQKIQMIQEVVEVIVDLIRSRRNTGLELAIVLLIIFEIILTVILYFL